MDINFLKNVLLFKELTLPELKFVASKMHLVHYKQGEHIIRENETGDTMYILYKGKVEISKKMTMLDDTQEIEMNKTFITISAEDYNFFGEIGLLCIQKRTATVSAKTECQLYSISQKIFNSICKENPNIGIKILLEISRKLSTSLEKTNEDVLKLTTALIYALQ